LRLQVGQDGSHESATVQEENARNSARSARKSAKMSMNLCSAVRSHIGAEGDYFVKGKSMDGLRKMCNKKRNRDSRGSRDPRKQQRPKRWKVA